MHRIRAVVPFAAVLALPMMLGGCVGALVVGGMAAAGGAGYEAAQERGVEGSYDDYALKNNIEDAWNRVDPRFAQTFGVTVYEGRVLLTGEAARPGMKERAAEVARGIRGVRHVYDQIEVAAEPGYWDTAKDAWITTQVRSDLIFEKGIRSENYEIETANRSVYLIGSARSQAELDKATSLARYVPGVKRVVSFVEIRSGSPVASGGEPPSLAGGAPEPAEPPSAAPPVPSAPIEVQKL